MLSVGSGDGDCSHCSRTQGRAAQGQWGHASPARPGCAAGLQEGKCARPGGMSLSTTVQGRIRRSRPTSDNTRGFCPLEKRTL